MVEVGPKAVEWVEGAEDEHVQLRREATIVEK